MKDAHTSASNTHGGLQICADLISTAPGTSIKSLKFCHMPAWDKWEVLFFNAKAVHWAAAAAGAAFSLGLSSIRNTQGTRLLDIVSPSPLQLSTMGRSALSMGISLLSEKESSHSVGSTRLADRESLVVGGIMMGTAAVIGLLIWAVMGKP